MQNQPVSAPSEPTQLAALRLAIIATGTPGRLRDFIAERQHDVQRLRTLGHFAHANDLEVALLAVELLHQQLDLE